MVGSIAALAEAEGVAILVDDELDELDALDELGAADDGAAAVEPEPPQAVRPSRAEAARPAIAKDVRFVASMTFLLQTY
ncbi:hypothetical protein GCM10027405_34490 [Arthrobacter alkaliphilus]